MLTVSEIINSKKRKQRKPAEEELRRLPDRKALIHGRLSGFSQVKDSKESMREIAAQVGKAIEDGFKTKLDRNTVERWLEEIQAGVVEPGVMEDGQVIVNCLGLGISGTLPEDKRPDLKMTMDLLRKGDLGAIYVTEGANRLSRDPDRVVSAMLLKLMKEVNCKLRTPYEVLSPCIERDWEIIHNELERGAEELKGMNKRLYQRKARKAARGEFVGEPIIPGFIIPIVSRRTNGEYEYGKMQPYLPHAVIDTKILREYIKQRGSELKTAQALKNLTFPFFPPELVHMQRRSSLRRCTSTPTGYCITPSLVNSLVRNPKLIGIWEWGDGEIIPNNHEPAVEEDLFLEAYELANKPAKSRGRSINFEPLEWARLIWCMNGPEPRQVSGHSAEEHYVCDRDYHDGGGPICLDITARFIDEPLTTEVLRLLDFTPYAEEILAKLEDDTVRGKMEDLQRKREEAILQQSIRKWEALLPDCVNSETYQVDREREKFYWEKINEAQARLKELKAKPIPAGETRTVDFSKVKDFLANLPHNWGTYPRTLRNRLLKLLIDRVELRHKRDLIETTIIWKTGFKQEIIIHRPLSKSSRDNRWTYEEDKLLRVLYPSSDVTIVEAALPNRSWKAISARAFRLGLKRERQYNPPEGWRIWTSGEDEELRMLYEAGTPLTEIATKLGRSINAIETRAAVRQLVRPASARWRRAHVRWKSHDLKPLQSGPWER